MISENPVTDTLYKRIHQLPPRVQHELSDYIEFLSQKYQTDKPGKPFFGCMKGTVTWMSDDFNDTPDDLKDYIE
ncbi:MAG: DUF2281 domain-containing protein [Tannerellaceae bacterium]|nr:DUF2281 domain-containing protein [Tannerellaceae bacterium]